ncbi:hypothetical protein QR685DRAFT_522890 [Neurospora intermedia]|uniref:Uncharacterized protein n=1 Tax=Neurospora intermedia TaxID=5142 RepID=A0ABR3DEG2_NEUIN
MNETGKERELSVLVSSRYTVLFFHSPNTIIFPTLISFSPSVHIYIWICTGVLYTLLYRAVIVEL